MWDNIKTFVGEKYILDDQQGLFNVGNRIKKEQKCSGFVLR